MSDQHSDDGICQHDSASYEGPVFVCECGERFVEYGALVDHIEKHAKEAA